MSSLISGLMKKTMRKLGLGGRRRKMTKVAGRRRKHTMKAGRRHRKH